MAWICIREVTDEDYEALNKAARRFAARHDLTRKVEDEIEICKAGGSKISYYAALERILELENGDYRQRFGGNSNEYTLWARCVCRALDVKGGSTNVGIAYGYVGERAED
jgi:hypothetical protein